MDIEELAAKVTELEGRTAIHGELLAGMEDNASQIATLSEIVTDLKLILDGEGDSGRGYQPHPSIRWWSLTAEEREASKHKIRGWVNEIAPLYGYLGTIPPCWEQHDLCLMILDPLAEAWSVLYVPKRRTPSMVTAQLDMVVRLLPALAQVFRNETRTCNHGATPYRVVSAP